MGQRIELFCDRCRQTTMRATRLTLNDIEVRDGEHTSYLGTQSASISIRGLELCGDCTGQVIALLGPCAKAVDRPEEPPDGW